MLFHFLCLIVNEHDNHEHMHVNIRHTETGILVAPSQRVLIVAQSHTALKSIKLL